MKIYLDTIGCRLNQSEIECMGRQFRAAGHEIVADPGGADLAVVNTCTVTAKAASDSRGSVRRIGRAGVSNIVVTGCWATLQGDEAAELPNVQRVVNNQHKHRLVPDVLDLPEYLFDLEPVARQPLPGLRQRTRAFIKVQDGCNNHCTFCITTVARGPSVSRSMEQVIADVQSAVDGGTKEVVLTGVHLGSWGQDIGTHLRELVRAVLRETDAPRVRLSSLEPWDLDADFFALWEDPRLCRHLHLPLQSGSAATLRRMARKTTPGSFRALVAAARTVMPDVAITTDVIAGFPGETESDFNESAGFVEEMRFAGGHAFSYSPRPGTAAARMPGQVPVDVRKVRNAAYRASFERSAQGYRAMFVGRRMAVLWESSALLSGTAWQLEGLTGNYLRVSCRAASPMWNQIALVQLETAGPEGVTGSIVTEP